MIGGGPQTGAPPLGRTDMDLAMRDEDARFRDEVRAFLDENLTDELKAQAKLTPGILPEQSLRAEWLAILNARGWAARAPLLLLCQCH